MKAMSSRDSARHGYSALASENFACLLGQSRPNDLVEKFRIGCQGRSQSTSVWPGTLGHLSCRFRHVMKQYYAAMELLANRLLRLLAIAAGIKDPAFWTGCLKDHVSTLTCNCYPAMPRAVLQGHAEASVRQEAVASTNSDLRMQAHTDVDMITILAQDTNEVAAPGLQVRSPCPTLLGRKGSGNQDAGWVHVPYERNMLIVNVGDALSQWPGLVGRWRSTEHRVLMPSKRMNSMTTLIKSGSEVSNPRSNRTVFAKSKIPARHSLAYFVAPHPHTIMVPPELTRKVTSSTPECSVTQNPAQPSQRLIKYKVWRRKRVAKALATLRGTVK